MDAVYEGWFHASHKLWATCNDCHTPHAFIPKYFVKARSGMNHVTMFTLGHYARAAARQRSTQNIIQENCIRCHETSVSMIADGGPCAQKRRALLL
jgi:cytochrome c nitrite reductase small subunit